MKFKFFFFGFTLVCLLEIQCLAQNQATQNLSPNDFAQKIKSDTSAIIIDVRSSSDFLKGHIENAINLEWDNQKLYEFTSKIDKNHPILVYCNSGGRSTSAAEKLRKNGYTNVNVLDGGLIKWRSQNLPEIHDNKNQPKGMNL